MKQIVKALFVAFATVALFSCDKAIQVPEESNEEVRTVQFSSNPITRTVFGDQVGNTLPTLWTDTYCVAVLLNYTSAKKSTTPEVGSGSTTATFEADMKDDDSGSYVFRAVSPYDQYISANSTYKSIQVEVPTAQTPSATSPDEKAQILYGEVDAGSTFPSSVTMNFSHITAYGKISFSNLSLADGESIASVSLTAAKNWAGRFYYYAEDHDPYSAGDIAESSASSTITITTTSSSNIWFGCAPVDLGGETVDVVITTNKGTTYSKTITIPAGKTFTSGKVNEFTINMSGIAAGGAVVYTLVEDVADLTLGSQVIIVADEYDFAISTTQNTNNRAPAAIIKSSKTISSPAADVQVFTIENGSKGGTYAFSTGTDYIYAASSSANHLKTQASLTDNSSWAISIDTGVATIKAVGTNSRNVLQYNNGTPNLFSCYASASQQAVSIYKRNGTGSGAINPKVAESLSITGATSSYSVDDSFSFDGAVSLVFSDTSEEVLNSSDYTVDDSDVNMSVAGTYTVTVTYDADNSVFGTYEISVTGGGGVTPSTNTATFSSAEYEGQGTSGTGSAVSLTKSVITVASDKAYGASGHVRVYSGGKISITSTGGNITKVEVTCTASGTSNNGPSKLSATGYSYSGAVGTWAGTATKTVVLDATAQVRFTQIVVTYETD